MAADEDDLDDFDGAFDRVFEEAEAAIEDALVEASAAADAAASEAAVGGDSVASTLDDIFAELESGEDEEGGEDEPARPRSRPQDRRIEMAVSNLVRILTSKREVTERDLQLVFEITKNKLVQAVNAEAVTIFLVEPDGIHFSYVAYARSLYRGNPKEERRFEEMRDRLLKAVLPPGTGIIGKVIEEGKAHITLNAMADPAFFKDVKEKTGFPVYSMMTVPMMFEGEVYGALQLLNKDPSSGEQFFSQRDLHLVEEVAEYSARAIYMARHPGHVWGEEDLARYVARLAKLEFVDLEEMPPDRALLQVVGEDNLTKYRIVPLKKIGSRSIKAAMDNPLDVARRDAFQLATDLDIEVLVVAPASQIRRLIDKAFTSGQLRDVRDAFVAELGQKQKGPERVVLSDTDEDSAPVIKLVNQIIEDAYARGASDIHIEPFEHELLVRYRTDGVLAEVMRMRPDAKKALTARIKIMSGLDISEQRLPQDGRIHFRDFSRSGLDIDLRVSTGPLIWGEKTVMRILDNTKASVGLDKLGYSQENLKRYLECVEQPYGMILHTGPTGSGKTTSLYAALDHCNEPDVNIMTAEDPVEYTMRGINQMQMKPEIGLDFARALRCYLRQDPDIILVGEIRDLETASIAIEAALTGHQVFSTLHTNDAAGTVTRLVEMGIEPFLITGSLLCVCAQRLVRRLCERCKEPHEPEPAELDLLNAQPGELEVFRAKPNGCPHCNETGYKGRLGIHELLVMNEAVQKIAAKKDTAASEIHEVAVREAGLIPLFDDAMAKVRSGVTDLAEALCHVRKM